MRTKEFFEGAKKTDYFKIPFGEFVEKVETFHFNPKARTENFPTDDDDFGLIDFIKNGGTVPPLEINKSKRNGDEFYQLVSGHRRRAAMIYCVEKGFEIEFVSTIVTTGLSEQQILARTMADSKNKHWTTSEKADACARFVAWGWPMQKIAECTGDSIGTITKLLKISNGAIPEIKEAIDNNEIPQKLGIEIIDESGGSTDEQKAALEKVEQEKKDGTRTKTGQKRNQKPATAFDKEEKDSGSKPKKEDISKVNKSKSVLDETCGRKMMSISEIEQWYEKLKTIIERSEQDEYHFECLEIILGYNVVIQG